MLSPAPSFMARRTVRMSAAVTPRRGNTRAPTPVPDTLGLLSLSSRCEHGWRGRRAATVVVRRGPRRHPFRFAFLRPSVASFVGPPTRVASDRSGRVDGTAPAARARDRPLERAVQTCVGRGGAGSRADTGHAGGSELGPRRGARPPLAYHLSAHFFLSARLREASRLA